MSATFADLVRCTWSVDGDGAAHALVPDACVDVVWRSDGTVHVCGPETTGWSYSLPVGERAVGVRLEPGAAPAVLGVHASTIAEQRVAMADLWGSRVGRVLAERATEGDPLAVLTEALRSRASGDVDDVALHVRSLAATGDLSVASAAREVAMSERQLRRRCTRAFGYGPATLARILRVQRFLAAARASGRSTSLVELALRAGYSDQPHASRDVKAIARITPAEVVRSVQDGEIAPG